jgi:hypothetical protein
MVSYTTTILKFEKQGEKTGWTYIDVPAAIAEQLKHGCKRSFRVKGKLDQHLIAQVALIPMGDGNFIMPINAAMRKVTGKRQGSSLQIQLQEDSKEYELNAALMDCLADEPAALSFFKSKPVSHQRYYSKWIDSAKTDATKIKRIALAVSSLAKKMDYGEMLRMQKELKNF